MQKVAGSSSAVVTISVSFSNTKGDFGQVCPAGFCLYDISQSSLTFRRFMTLFDDAFEASETLVSLTDVV